MPNRSLPSVVYHADWGTKPSKRWIARAVLKSDRYVAYAPKRVHDHKDLMAQARAAGGHSGIAVIGFDFPIGIPAVYARLVDVAEFKPLLLRLGQGEWRDFSRVCSTASEITKWRPFYPDKPGGKKQQHLLSALDLSSINDLRRRCELGRDGRKAACPLFWTLGANQVGKGAIIGWQDVLASALRTAKPALIWPFDGSLDELLQPGNVVIVETYPAECYGWFFEKGLKGKGKLEVLKKAGGPLLRWAEKANIKLEKELIKAVEGGFLHGGDDAFDATVGLFGMLEVILDRRKPGDPNEEAVRNVEGWIFGQQ
jgi:hypothetical protein